MEGAGNSSPTKGQMAAGQSIRSGSAFDPRRDVGEAAVSQMSVPRVTGPRRPFSRPARRDYRSWLPVPPTPDLRDRGDGAIVPDLDDSQQNPDSTTTTPPPQQPSVTVAQPVPPVTGTKRGRETESRDKAPVPDLEMATVNGVPIDLTALKVSGDDVYNGGLSRRTSQMDKEQLKEFLDRLGGQWLNLTHTRVCVDASHFGDVLPAGWKVAVALKRPDSDGRTFPYLSRYISPNGEGFPSCKKIARFLKSQCLSMAANQKNVRVLREEQRDDGGNCTAIVPYQAVMDVAPIGEEDNGVNSTEFGPCQDAGALQEEEEDNGLSRAIVPYAAPESHGLEIWSSEGTDDLVDAVESQGQYECAVCNMKFDEHTEYARHRRFHRNTRAGYRKRPPLTDGVIMKDGKYGCQFCSKVFDKKISYTGHVGIHLRRNLTGSAAARYTLPQHHLQLLNTIDEDEEEEDEDDELANLRLLSEVSTTM